MRTLFGPVEDESATTRMLGKASKRCESFFEGNVAAAEQVAFEKMQGVTPNSRHYMPLADWNIEMDFPGKAKQYRRSLDLEHALAAVQFTANDVSYLREVFVSYPDRVMVVHLTATEPGKIS